MLVQRRDKGMERANNLIVNPVDSELLDGVNEERNFEKSTA